MKGNGLKRVAVDATAMEKNIAHPTDARLHETARRKLVGPAREAGPVAKLLRRRAAVEPMIGHMKTDGRLTRCPLERADGDALCGRGHNIRMILGHLREVSCRLILPPTTLCQINDAEMATAGPRQIVKAPA